MSAIVASPATGVVPFAVQAIASQTANLQEWQNSSGTALTAVTAAGDLNVHGVTYTWPSAQGASGNTTFLSNDGTGVLSWALGSTISPVTITAATALKVINENLLSSATGNTRGTGAVDFQMKRTQNQMVASANYGTLCGGLNNKISGTGGVICGGGTNVAGGNYSSVLGGKNNGVSVGTYGVVCGGQSNSAGGSCFVGGGKSNSAGNNYTTICGGNSNSTTGGGGVFIGGGNGNFTNTWAYHVICGGKGNNIQSGTSYQSILGGQSNAGQATFSTIGGGKSNTVSGSYGAILGGRQALANKYGQQAYSAGQFAAQGDAQTCQYILRIKTTNSTALTEMFLDGSSARLVLPNDSTWAFMIYLVARRTDADNESAYFRVEGGIDRNANAASTALVGAGVTKTVVVRDTSTWDVTVDADTTNGSLRIQVQDTAGGAKTIAWVAFVRMMEVTG